MPYKTTRDILDRAKAFHTNISKHYHTLSAAVEKEKVKILLGYLSRHEKNLAKSLEEYEEEASREILENWFKFTPENSINDFFRDLEVTPSMSVDDVISLALSFDNRLVDLYREAARISPSEEVREVFNNLLEMEKEEELILMRDALEIKEL